MSRSGMAFVVLALLAVMALPSIAPPAAAADTPVTLIAKNTVWHIGSETSSDTAIRANVGDTLRLRVENHDTFFHTFTAPQFNVDASLDAGDVFFWNHTVASSDVGTWQYYCTPHSSGTYPNRSGMVGTLVFTNPSGGGGSGAPADYTLLIASVVIVIVVIGAVAAVMMRRKKGGGTGPSGGQQPPTP